MSVRLSVWLLASAGVLLGHVVGYAVAYPNEADRAVALAGHAYLGPVGVVLIPAGLCSVLTMAVRTVRRAGSAPALGPLAAAQMVMFAGQELLERVSGPGVPLDAVGERGVWFGLVAQVLVAWVTLRLVTFAARTLRAVTATSAHRSTVGVLRVRLASQVAVPMSQACARLERRRGPPSRPVPPLPS